MTECTLCSQQGIAKKSEQTYPCVLCGENRCINHAIWVPSYDLERDLKGFREVREFISGTHVGGWFSFCGNIGHVPRGVTIRHGLNRSGGKLVEYLSEYDRPKGFEFFRAWETGIVEDGFESRWETKDYIVSCSLQPIMRLIMNLEMKGGAARSENKSVLQTAIHGFATKKMFFSRPSDALLGKIGELITNVLDLVKVVCAYCLVSVCTNRQAPYYDEKHFQKIIKNPHLISDQLI